MFNCLSGRVDSLSKHIFRFILFLSHFSSSSGRVLSLLFFFHKMSTRVINSCSSLPTSKQENATKTLSNFTQTPPRVNSISIILGDRLFWVGEISGFFEDFFSKKSPPDHLSLFSSAALMIHCMRPPKNEEENLLSIISRFYPPKMRKIHKKYKDIKLASNFREDLTKKIKFSTNVWP